MNFNNTLQPKRLWLLMRMELTRGRNGLLLTLAVIFGINFFGGIILKPLVEKTSVISNHGGYVLMLIVGGFILSSLAFADMGNSLKRYHYLTLPASTFEKFLSTLLLTTVGWVVIYTVLFTIYCWIANIIGSLIYPHVTFVNFNPFDSLTLLTIRHYLVLQGIFLVGAVHFKNYVFLKTLFSLILFAVFCGLITYFFVSRCIQPANYLTDIEQLRGTPAESMLHAVQGIYWWALAPLAWVITYLGLKESEG